MFNYKSATKKELKEHFRNIAQKNGDELFFTKKEIYYLPEILEDNEEVLTFASGLMDSRTWLITLTTKRVIFLDKGMFWGLRQTEIELSKIQSIQSQEGFLLGSISISDGSSLYSINNVIKKAIKPFIKQTREQISFITSNTKQSPNRLDDLQKIFEMKESGILTDEEYQREKNALLS